MDMDTDELLNTLKDENIEKFPKELFKDIKVDAVKYLNDLLKAHNVTVKELIPKLDYDRSYIYQMFNGTRTPTRVFVLRLAVLLRLDYNETQKLLFVTGNTLLYPKIQFDAVMIYSLERHLSEQEIEELLKENHEKSLFW